MANYNFVERKIANFLSSNPALKNLAKGTYQKISYLVYKKPYRFKSNYKIEPIFCSSDESFFGYYDNNPRRGSLELFQSTSVPTSLDPVDTLDLDKSCLVVVKSATDKTIKYMKKTSAFNWQQGSKLQWVSDDSFIYNDIVDRTIKAKLVNIETGSEKIFDDAVYDSFNNSFYLSLDYRPLTTLRPDYAYFIKDGWGSIDFKSQAIKKVLFDGSSEVVVDIATLAQEFPLSFNCDISSQKFNHIMISKDGEQALFLHRAYTASGVRIDRLFCVSLKNKYRLKLISDSGMISHYCWVDSNNILAYMRHNNVNGYFFVDIENKKFTKIELPQLDQYGDGHPTYIGDGLFVTDTYPDKSRMKSLLLVDTNNRNVEVIGEFFEPLKFSNQTRCDLHPKWDSVNKFIYFDSVHEGERRLYKIGLPK